MRNCLCLHKSDLVEIKEDLKLHLATLIDRKLDRMMEQILSLSSTIKEVANTANAMKRVKKTGALLRMQSGS